MDKVWLVWVGSEYEPTLNGICQTEDDADKAVEQLKAVGDYILANARKEGVTLLATPLPPIYRHICVMDAQGKIQREYLADDDGRFSPTIETLIYPGNQLSVRAFGTSTLEARHYCNEARLLYLRDHPELDVAVDGGLGRTRQ